MDHAAAAQNWIDTHPRAVVIFERMALARAQVRQRFGMKALVEAVRWHYAIERTEEDSEWKLNNSYTAYLARWLIARNPELADLIETRTTRSEAA